MALSQSRLHKVYAQRAMQLADSYDDGYAEALNNLAFVSLAKMQYRQAQRQLEDVLAKTDNQIEQFVADVQLMRLCQRESRNKDFYDYRERAESRLKRLREDVSMLSAHEKRRLIYAEIEFRIVASTYFFMWDCPTKPLARLSESTPTVSFGKTRRRC